MPTHILRRLGWNAVGLACGLALPALAHAQAGGALPLNDTYTTISNVTLMVTQFLNILTWFVFSFLIFLLDPRFIFDMAADGTEGSLMDVLNSIWQLSRNLMNVAFAVGLVAAAIYTVVTANKEFVSAHLKTFIMAVVLVNFSWFIPRVAMDIANIATATVYSIPSAIVDDAASCKYESTTADGCFGAEASGEGFLCECKAVADFEPFPGTDRANALIAETSGDDPTLAWQCNLAYCVRFVPLSAVEATPQGSVLNGLIINHARLPSLATITRTDVDDDIADLLLFILRQMVVIVIHIALFFPLVALLIALVIRIPILWLTIAFMPFYFLSWVIPDEIPLGAVKEKAKMIWDWFLKAAFLPAAVAVPLSVGFIMANAGSRVSFSGVDGINFNLIDGMGHFGQLLWVIMVLGILWSGTFMVLQMMTAEMPGADIINSIKSTGEEAGKFAAELPLSVAPIPGVGNLLNLKDILHPSALRRAARHRDGFMAGLGELGTDRGRERGEVDRATEKLRNDPGARATLANNIDAFNRGTGDFAQLQKDLAQQNIAVTKDNFQRIIEELHANLLQGGGNGLLTNQQLNAFIAKAASVRAPAQPPAPAAPAQPANPPPNPNPAGAGPP